MISTLQQILLQAWERLWEQVVLILPNVLAMLLILVAGWIVAHLAQWVLHRMSTRLRRSLLEWGVPDRYGQANAADLLARGVFWIILGGAMLMGINALTTELGSRLVSGALLFFPRVLSAALVVLAGSLLGRFLARSALIWAVNEGIGPARWIASGVRVGVGLLTLVAATEQLAVARTAVLTAFIILLSGTVLAVALALGLGSRKRVEQWLDRRAAFLAEGKSEEERIEHL